MHTNKVNVDGNSTVLVKTYNNYGILKQLHRNNSNNVYDAHDQWQRYIHKWHLTFRDHNCFLFNIIFILLYLKREYYIYIILYNNN